MNSFTSRCPRTSPSKLTPLLQSYAAAPISSSNGHHSLRFRLHINIGPNVSPIVPPENDKSVAVLVVEPNIGVAHYLREEYQKKRYVSRFFVINAAIAGPPHTGRFLTFNHYNVDGASSSLSSALEDARGRPQSFANRKSFDPSAHYGPGPAGVDFVPVLPLEALLRAVPSDVDIPYLKTDTQGFDLEVVKSASVKSLRRVGKIMSETYLPGIAKVRYRNVRNELGRDWIPYMKKVGFGLTNPTNREMDEYDAVWVRK